ncbi:MAG: hypothetical protein M1815_004722 [Lichina confinis]|nr:MAG: hypothetical protein M1815_004722 [Lichina confinis]
MLTPKDEEFLERIAGDNRTAYGPARDPLDALDVEETGGTQAQLVASNTEPIPQQYDVGHRQPEARHAPLKRQSEPKTLTKDPKRGSDGTNRWSFIQRLASKKDKDHRRNSRQDKNELVATSNEAATENNDIAAMLDKLSLEAGNNKAFSLSNESRELVKQFTQILKDIVNGVPTAYDDLMKLFDNSQEQLDKTYNNLPAPLQKLIKALPTKLTKTMGPGMVAAAAQEQGASSGEAGDMKAAATKAGVRMPSVQDMITKPGAIVGMLKAIMNFLKLRFPAFLGTILLLALWYFHKRGREVRLAKEQLAAGNMDGSWRIEELDDDDDDDDDVDPEVSRAINEATGRYTPQHAQQQPAARHAPQLESAAPPYARNGTSSRNETQTPSYQR